MPKAPPRETAGKGECLTKGCTATAAVKRDAGGFLYLSCPECGTINNRRPAFQARLAALIAPPVVPDPEPVNLPEPIGDPMPIEKTPSRSVLGGLSIFS